MAAKRHGRGWQPGKRTFVLRVPGTKPVKLKLTALEVATVLSHIRSLES